MPFPYPPTPIGTGPEVPSARSDAPRRALVCEDEALRRPPRAVRAEPRDHRPGRDRAPLPAHPLAGRDRRGARTAHARRVLPRLGTAALADAARRVQDAVGSPGAGLRERAALARGATADPAPTARQHRSSSSAGTFGRKRSSSSRSACEARSPHRPARRRARGLLGQQRLRRADDHDQAREDVPARRPLAVEPASHPESRSRSASPSSSRRGSR